MDYLAQTIPLAPGQTHLLWYWGKKRCHCANEISSILTDSRVHSWTGTCNTNFITDTSALTKERAVIKTGFSVNPYKGNSGSAKTVLTLHSDKYNRSNWSITWFTSPVAFVPSQTTAKKCFVTFCGCRRLPPPPANSLFLPSVCASHPFTTCYYSGQRLEQPPQGQLGKWMFILQDTHLATQ